MKEKKQSATKKKSAHVDSDSLAIEYRELNFAKDMDAIKRIWDEIGWATEESEQQAMNVVFAVDDTVVGSVNVSP
jgi:hypothetical protein